MGRNWCSVDRWYFHGRDAVAAAAAKYAERGCYSHPLLYMFVAV